MQDFLSGRGGMRIDIPEDPKVEVLQAKLTKATQPSDRVKIRQELINIHQKRVLLMLSNRLIQFVDQVAGNLGDDFTKYLRGIHKEFDQFLKSDGRDPCRDVIQMIQRLAPGLTTEELSRIEQYEHRLAMERQTENSTAAFLHLTSLPTMLASDYFTSVLSAGVRGALFELGQTIALTEPQAEVFHYLIRSVKWMPAFAKLVSVVILLNRKKSWVSASGIMIKQAKEDLYYALKDFLTFRMHDGSEMYRESIPFAYPVMKRTHPPLPLPSESSKTKESGEEASEEEEPEAIFESKPPASFGSTQYTEKPFSGPPRLYNQNLQAKFGGFNV
jgi:hypothetical protein